eukprot:Rmarinus@m.13918
MIEVPRKLQCSQDFKSVVGHVHEFATLLATEQKSANVLGNERLMDLANYCRQVVKPLDHIIVVKHELVKATSEGSEKSGKGSRDSLGDIPIEDIRKVRDEAFSLLNSFFDHLRIQSTKPGDGAQQASPTATDINQYAREIGFDAKAEPQLAWIAEQGLKEPLQDGWVLKRDATGSLYYHHESSGDSTAHNPRLEDHRRLYDTLRDQKSDGPLAQAASVAASYRTSGKPSPPTPSRAKKPKKSKPNLLSIEVPGEDVGMHRSYSVSVSGTFTDRGFQINRRGIRTAPSAAEKKRRGIATAITVRAFEELTLLERLGVGSGGLVRLARHEPTGLQCAVKVMSVMEDDKRKQMLNEIHVLSQATSPHVVAFHGAFFEKDALFLVMEWMDGGSLADVMARMGPFPEPILAAVTEQVLLGLQYLHVTKRQVHRDVKPANILLSRTGRVKISDFGIAAELSSISAKCATMVGTGRYMAPERLRGASYSFAADVWAVGLCVAEFATGKYPYEEAATYLDLADVIIKNPTVQLGPNFSPELRSFVESCMREDESLRLTPEALLLHPFIRTYGHFGKRSIARWLRGLDYISCSSEVTSREADGAGNQSLHMASPRLPVHVEEKEKNPFFESERVKGRGGAPLSSSVPSTGFLSQQRSRSGLSSISSGSSSEPHRRSRSASDGLTDPSAREEQILMPALNAADVDAQPNSRGLEPTGLGGACDSPTPESGVESSWDRPQRPKPLKPSDNDLYSSRDSSTLHPVEDDLLSPSYHEHPPWPSLGEGLKDLDEPNSDDDASSGSIMEVGSRMHNLAVVGALLDDEEEANS